VLRFNLFYRYLKLLNQGC